MEASLLTSGHKNYEYIESCFEAASAAWICADASIHEEDAAQLKSCIGICLEAAEVCAQTARSFLDTPDPVQINKCIRICTMAKEECKRFEEVHEHCYIAARCCDQCIRACETYLSVISLTTT